MIVARIAAAAQPQAQALCTVPTALPRSLARMTSPISTEPAAHSPPKPKPWRPRTISNCSKLLVKPDRKVKNANHADHDHQQPGAADAVGEHAGDPAAEGGNHQRAGRQQSGLRIGDVPDRDQRRHDEAVDLHVERIERPAAEAGQEVCAWSRQALDKNRACATYPEIDGGGMRSGSAGGAAVPRRPASAGAAARCRVRAHGRAARRAGGRWLRRSPCRFRLLLSRQAHFRPSPPPAR